jgi:hypothetical protein
MKLKKIRGAGRIACIEKNKNDRKSRRKDITIETRKRIVLKRILQKENGDWTRLAQENADSVVGSGEYSNDPLGFIIFREFLMLLSNCWLFVKESVSWS